ncbi:Serine/threonine-protein kinase Aurora-3 [Diplonema papillatum]|nr:Serine/threonine-protein kinase Aurora-3 [Diplonema papillatum]
MFPDLSPIKGGDAGEESGSDEGSSSVALGWPLGGGDGGESRPAPPAKGKLTWRQGDFTIGSRLGGGTHSQVFVAREKATRFVCALKIIKKASVARGKLAERIQSEVEIQRTLRHPNILKLFAYFHDADRIYLVLEYCPGGQLYQMIGKTGMPEPEAASFVRQVVSALRYLHGKGYVHRDVKPENLLIDKRGTLRLADFGWAVPSRARRMTVCGTLDYMAPELLAEPPSHSSPVDLWAVGAVAHELLCGSPPFALPTSYQTYQNIVHAEYQPPSSFSVHAASFVASLLIKSESERMTIEQATLHAFVRSPRS